MSQTTSRNAGRADATIGAEIKRGKQFFDYTVRKRYLHHNPFKTFRVARQTNRRRFAQVPWETIQTVIDVALSTEWRALIAIVRRTGCRNSPALLLKWGDIPWDEKKTVIASIKPGGWQPMSNVLCHFGPLCAAGSPAAIPSVPGRLPS